MASSNSNASQANNHSKKEITMQDPLLTSQGNLTKFSNPFGGIGENNDSNRITFREEAVTGDRLSKIAPAAT